MKDWVILTLNKPAYLKMAKVENDLDIYYAVGNANTKRQESEIKIGRQVNKFLNPYAI